MWPRERAFSARGYYAWSTEKLGALLVREGLITAVELDEGLRAQQIYGGRLGTNLVETGDLDIEVLSRKLAQQRGFPVATQAEMDAVTSTTLGLVSANLAKKHQAFPLAQEGRRPKVAMAAPYDPSTPTAFGSCPASCPSDVAR